jgi:hypothetical protein
VACRRAAPSAAAEKWSRERDRCRRCMGIVLSEGEEEEEEEKEEYQ